MSALPEPPLTAVAADTLSVQPLIDSLKKDPSPSDIVLELTTPAGCAERFQNRTAGLALLSSFDYAALSGQQPLRIVPRVAVVTRQKAMNALLLFRKGISRIGTVAVDSRDNALAALLKIVLKEKYRTEPAFIPLPPDPDNMLAKADAAMISGDQALGVYESFDLKIDLGEDWEDITEGLPFVHSFWAAHPEKIKPDHVSAVMAAKHKGLERIPDLVDEYRDRMKSPFERNPGLDYLGNCVSYDFGRQEQEGVKEFFSYCYYYGFIGDIPDLRFVIV